MASNPLAGIFSPDDFYEAEPGVGYTQHLKRYQPGSAMYDWAGRQFQRYYNEYLADVANNWENGDQFSWMRYLERLDPTAEFNRLGSRDRGFSPMGNFAARSRWFSWG